MGKTYIKNPDIISRKIAGESILVPIRNNSRDLEYIFALNETSSRIWELIDGHNDAAAIAETLALEFAAAKEEIEADLADCLTSLEENGFITGNAKQ